MSRVSLLTSAFAVAALGAGAMGYAETSRRSGDARTPGAVIASSPPLAEQPRRVADRVIEIGRSEELAAALLKAGVAGLDAALAADTAGPLGGRVELWLGQKVGPDARALERLSFRIGAGRQVTVERSGEGFVRRNLIEAVDSTPVRIRLGQEEVAAGLVEAQLPRDLRDTVLDRVSGLRLAAIDLIVAHESSASRAIYGQPLYLGVHLADGSIRRWLGEKGDLRALGSDDEAPSGLLRPLSGPVTSNPGLRFHPILRYFRWHHGTDFASPAGTPVQAAAEGRVIDAAWRGGYGRTVRIAHPDGSTTLYAHLSTVEVAAGQAVPRGAVLGAVGSTGLATGPHLHFEWQRSGATLRPEFGAGRVAEMEAMPAQRKTLQALLSAPFQLPPRRRS